MRKAILLLLLSAPAFAGGDKITQSNDNNAQTTGDVAIKATGIAVGQGGDGGDGIGIGIGKGGQGGDGGRGGTGHGGDGGDATGGAASAAATTGPIENSSGGGNATVNTESNNTNVVLAPNNNTAGCLGVWGFAFGNGDTAATAGVPRRDEACDFEHAADDAAAIGNHYMAWYWRCHKKNLWKPFKRRGVSEEQAIQACHAKMVQMLGLVIPEPGAVLVPEDEYDELLAQASASERVEEYAELTEERIAEQQNLIESLQADHDRDQAEIDRLKREAAALRKAQEADEERVAQRQSALQAILEKRESKEEEPDE